MKVFYFLDLSSKTIIFMSTFWDHHSLLCALSFCNCALFSSVHFSHSVVSDSATPWAAAHRPPCPSPTPRACSNSRPSSQWYHPTISSSVIPSYSCPQSFPASGSFQWGSFSYQVAEVLELQHQFSSATQSCPTLCDPMNCSTPGLPVHHQLPEFT